MQADFASRRYSGRLNSPLVVQYIDAPTTQQICPLHNSSGSTSSDQGDTRDKEARRRPKSALQGRGPTSHVATSRIRWRFGPNDLHSGYHLLLPSAFNLCIRTPHDRATSDPQLPLSLSQPPRCGLDFVFDTSMTLVRVPHTLVTAQSEKQTQAASFQDLAAHFMS